MSVDIIRETGLEARMADGVHLVADAWHPASGGPWPTLLQRLPYGRAVASSIVLPHPTWFARRGYAVVVQDVRGTGASQGEFVPFVHEAGDGSASVEWAAALPFSDGNVGMYGFSYQGLCQLYAASQRPPSLRAIAPMMCAADPYEGWTYEGGCLRLAFAATWGAQLVDLSSRGTATASPDLDAIPFADALGPEPPAWFREWLDHPDLDAYWTALRPDLDAIDVPVFTVVGWFDDFSAANMRFAERLQAEAVLGPWSHIPWGTRFGALELGEEASPRAAFEGLAGFFDRHLRGLDDTPTARCRYYAGGHGWKTSASWPPPGRVERWAGTSAGDANSRHGGGRLVRGETEPGHPDVLVSEPLVPFPSGQSPLASVAADEDRRDVLCYTTEPLAGPLDLAGSALAALRVRCDWETFDLIASLVLVEPGGEARVLSYGARHVEAPAGTAVGVEIELRPIAWRCPAGWRLRLDIAPSRFPALARNPHAAVAAPLAQRAEYGVATIELLEAVLDLPIDG